ncbi:MAG: tfuA protein [Sphingomonadaceae bacterium]|nr:tfuA protein [Sphingomonadaceae bacterium]
MTERPIIVFAGPSLPRAVRPADPRFDWWPPAAAGDLLRLIEHPPRAVCLIDGYFDARPAPWHKEILLLIEAGTRVLGAASIGALRAAELDRHGMTGVGAIYRAYRQGRITGDDEVALIHAPEALGWQPLSEPMIEVRATLAAAARPRIIDIAAARALRAAALAIHFGERDWSAIIARADLPDRETHALKTWLPQGVVRLKQADAMLCLERATQGARGGRIGAAVPVTCFISALAIETGTALPGDRHPDRSHRAHAARAPGSAA